MSNHVHILASDGHTAVAAWLSSFRRESVLTVRRMARDALPLEARSGRFWLRGGGHRRAIWSLQEYWQEVQYIHQNPVRAGLCRAAIEWRWNSASEYAGVVRHGMPTVAEPPEGLTDLLWWRAVPDQFGVDRR